MEHSSSFIRGTGPGVSLHARSLRNPAKREVQALLHQRAKRTAAKLGAAAGLYEPALWKRNWALDAQGPERSTAWSIDCLFGPCPDRHPLVARQRSRNRR